MSVHSCLTSHPCYSRLKFSFVFFNYFSLFPFLVIEFEQPLRWVMTNESRLKRICIWITRFLFIARRMDSTIVGTAIQLCSNSIASMEAWFEVNPELLSTSTKEKRPTNNRFSDSLLTYSSSKFKKHYRMSRGNVY